VLGQIIKKARGETVQEAGEQGCLLRDLYWVSRPAGVEVGTEIRT